MTAARKTLVIDLAGLTYMASAGLVALHSAAILMAGGEPPDPEGGWDTLLGFGADGTGDRLREGLKLAGADTAGGPRPRSDGHPQPLRPPSRHGRAP